MIAKNLNIVSPKPFIALLLTLVLAACSSAPWPLGSGAPTARYPAPVERLEETVEAKRGDTVYAISRRYGVSVRELIEANSLRPPYVIHTGQRLTLPRPRTHKVVRGDTLYGISSKYGVNSSDLARVNRLKPPYMIRIGEMLRLPGGTASPPKRTASKKSTQIRSSFKAPPAAAVPKPPRRSGNGFLWPVRGRVLSNFGAKAGGLHNDGINIAAKRGTSVKAAENGVVAYAGNELRGFGNLLLVKHDGGWVTAYAHNDSLKVKRGDKVRKGQSIATIGSTGNVVTPQLHFELRKGKRAVNPKQYLGKFPS